MIPPIEKLADLVKSVLEISEISDAEKLSSLERFHLEINKAIEDLEQLRAEIINLKKNLGR